MKKYFSFVILLPALLLPSCGKLMHENAIYNTNFLVDETSQKVQAIDINYLTLENMINGKQTFVVLFHRDGCTPCSYANENINKYANNYGKTFYRVEYNEVGINELKLLFPDYFSSLQWTPTVYIFDKGILTFEYDNSNVIEYNSFVSQNNILFYDSNISTGISSNPVETYINNTNEFNMVIYDSKDVNSMLFYSTKIFEVASKSSTKTLALDLNTIEDSTGEILRGIFGEEITTTSSISHVSQKTKKDTINYLVDSVSIDTFINQYYL